MQSTPVFWIALLQCAVVLWLHHATLSLNMRRLRRTVTTRIPEKDGSVWIDSAEHIHGFHLCKSGSRCNGSTADPGSGNALMFYSIRNSVAGERAANPFDQLRGVHGLPGGCE